MKEIQGYARNHFALRPNTNTAIIAANSQNLFAESGVCGVVSRDEN